MKKYRLQKRDHLGVVNRAFGGRCVHWSPWKTTEKFTDRELAEASFDFQSRRGLCQWRLMFGADVVRERN
jgi:hypothetical protein